MHFNIRKIKYKVSEIKNIIKHENPDIFGLSECDLKREGFDTNNLKIPGYEVFISKILEYVWLCSSFSLYKENVEL